MPARNRNLHGSAPDDAAAALLIVDLISDFEFENGAKLVRAALPAARRIRRLKERARAAGIPAIYVNDNFGRWRSDFRELVRHCLADDVRGAPIVRLLEPDADDYFILKPKHSGFYATALDTLLSYIGVEKVILTGVATHQCVLFTANDAYMRDLTLFAPADCIVSNTAADNDHALQQIETVLKGNVAPSTQLRVRKARAARPGQASRRRG